MPTMSLLHLELALFTVGAFLPACLTAGDRSGPSERRADAVVTVPPPTRVQPAPRPALAPRAERLSRGLAAILGDLRAGSVTVDQAFERIRALERTVGPPEIELPPHVDACTQDSDCALTDRALTGDPRYLCCDSLRRTAGTVAWVKQVEAACRGYECLRGPGPRQLPGCGIATGPISATTTRCRASRCVACMEPTDGSPILCHSPGR
jgi:hypothetical protein